MYHLTPGHHSDHALTALFAAHPGDEDNLTWKENAADLLADLMHFADAQIFDFDEALDDARDHYSRERQE